MESSLDDGFWNEVKSELLNTTAKLTNESVAAIQTPYRIEATQPTQQRQPQQYSAFPNGIRPEEFSVHTPALLHPSASNLRALDQARSELKHVHVRVDDAQSGLGALSEEIEKLRRIAVESQQQVESLQAAHAVMKREVAEHQAAIVELASSRPSRDAWAARTDASIKAMQEQWKSVHHRVEERLGVARLVVY